MINEIVSINLTRKIGLIKVKQAMNQVYLIPEQILLTCEFKDLAQLCEDVSTMLHCVVNNCYVPTLEEVNRLPKEIRACGAWWWTSTMSPYSCSAYYVNTGGNIGNYDFVTNLNGFRPIIVIDYEEYKTLMKELRYEI